MSIARLCVVSVVTISLVLAEPSQMNIFNNFDYESFNLEPITTNYYRHDQSRTHYGKSNNRYFDPYNQQNQNSDIVTGSDFQPPSCDSYWHYENNYDGVYGIVTIPDPDYRKIDVRLTLSVAAQLPSVSFLIYVCEHKFGCACVEHS